MRRRHTTPAGADTEQDLPVPLVVTLTRLEDEVLSFVAGEVDHFSAPLLAARLEEAHALGVERAVVDISGLTFVDGAGLGVLVRCTRSFRARGGDLVLVGVRPTFVQIVELLALSRALTLGSRERAADR